MGAPKATRPKGARGPESADPARGSAVAASDEALRTLVGRVRDGGASEEFAELTARLTARGHAAEALQVADRGLERHPRSVEGRLERAAALLALGRPKVAYVELRRVLALAPAHRRALRLLGQAFKRAGEPARAGELLAGRAPPPDATQPGTIVVASSERDHAEDTLPDAEPRPDLTLEAAGEAAIDPDLFRSLTEDLGLGDAEPPGTTLPPEVTLVVRPRGAPAPRSRSELSAVRGPIVESSQPGLSTPSERRDAEPSAREVTEPGVPPLLAEPTDDLHAPDAETLPPFDAGSPERSATAADRAATELQRVESPDRAPRRVGSPDRAPRRAETELDRAPTLISPDPAPPRSRRSEAPAPRRSRWRLALLATLALAAVVGAVALGQGLGPPADDRAAEPARPPAER